MKKVPIFFSAMILIGAALADQIDLNRADELIKDPKTLVLDVRTRNEYLGGHIRAAVNIPIQELKTRWEELPLDKKTTIVVCDNGEKRALRAHRVLKSGGYKNTHYLRGGLDGWEASGRPITTRQ